ncbi:MAG: hypothetical protein JWN04_1782, partial [Myxococcaceae bacterium]|nr:hypothetical protein [Myxococcaceae bacterium]
EVLSSQKAPPALKGAQFALAVTDGLMPFLRELSGAGSSGASYRPVIGLLGGELAPSFVARLPSQTHLVTTFDNSERGERLHARIQHAVSTARKDLTVSRWSRP